MRRPAEILTQREVSDLLSASPGNLSGLRLRCAVVLMWRAGLRCAEALALRPIDLDLDNGTIRVLHGKGDKARTVAIDPWGAGEVRAWLEHRKAWTELDDAPLLCTRTGRRLNTGTIRRQLPWLAKRAGISKRVHAHGLRHSHAVMLRQAGLEIGIISKQLGHSSITTTAIYLDHIMPSAVIRAVRAVEWEPV